MTCFKCVGKKLWASTYIRDPDPAYSRLELTGMKDVKSTNDAANKITLTAVSVMRLKAGWEVGVYIGSTDKIPSDLFPYDQLKTSGCNYTVSQYSSFSLARWSGITNNPLDEVRTSICYQCYLILSYQKERDKYIW